MEVALKNIGQILALLCLNFSLQANAVSVVCKTEDNQPIATMEVKGPIFDSFESRTCLKRDESEPGCNDIYAYYCPCVEVGPSRLVEYSYWELSGKIHMKVGKLSLPRFKFALTEALYDKNIYSGQQRLTTGTGYDNPRYDIVVKKGLADNAPLFVEIKIHPGPEHEQVKVFNSTCQL